LGFQCSQLYALRSLPKPNRAPLHSACHGRAVGIADDGIEVVARSFGVGFHRGLPT